ncbi:MAG: DUF427 domain-containing protein [Anaerolineales bacterium]
MGVKVVWNDAVLAESDHTEMVEGNHYFPPEALNREYFREGKMKTVCPWKGLASYYDIEVNGDVRRGGAWYYPDPSDAASHIRDHVAFYQRGGVRVVSSEG